MNPGELLDIPMGTRERVQKAVLALQEAGERVTVRAVVARAAPCSRDHVSALVRAVKDGELDPSAPWVLGSPGALLELAPGVGRLLLEEEDGEPGEAAAEQVVSLAALVQRAATLDDLQAAGGECGRLLAAGELEPNVANAIARLLTEQRQVVLARREAEGDDRPDHCAAVAPDSHEAARIFEDILDGRVRRDLLKTLREAAERDHERFPRELLEEPERAKELLAEAGLDAFGEPVEAA